MCVSIGKKGTEKEGMKEEEKGAKKVMPILLEIKERARGGMTW